MAERRGPAPDDRLPGRLRDRARAVARPGGPADRRRHLRADPSLRSIDDGVLAPRRGRRPEEVTMGRPYGLLRVGFPYLKTVGMRRVTNFPVDVAIGKDGRLYVLCRSAGAAQISRLTLDDEDLGPVSGF